MIEFEVRRVVVKSGGDGAIMDIGSSFRSMFPVFLRKDGVCK